MAKTRLVSRGVSKNQPIDYAQHAKYPGGWPIPFGLLKDPNMSNENSSNLYCSEENPLVLDAFGWVFGVLPTKKNTTIHNRIPWIHGHSLRRYKKAS